MKNNCFLCFVVFLFLFSSYAFTQDSLLFIVRVDDILSRNTTTQPRSIVPFEQVIESFGAKVSWAVIPHRLVEPENNDGHLIAELAATVQKVTKWHSMATITFVFSAASTMNFTVQLTINRSPMINKVPGFTMENRYCRIAPALRRFRLCPFACGRQHYL